MLRYRAREGAAACELRAGPTDADLATAQSAVAGAQATLSIKSGGTRPSDVALQTEAVRQAQVAPLVSSPEQSNMHTQAITAPPGTQLSPPR